MADKKRSLARSGTRKASKPSGRARKLKDLAPRARQTHQVTGGGKVTAEIYVEPIKLDYKKGV